MKVWTRIMLTFSLVEICVSEDVEGSGEYLEGDLVEGSGEYLEVECLQTTALLTITAPHNVGLDYWHNEDDKSTVDIIFDNEDEGSGTHLNISRQSSACAQEYCPPSQSSPPSQTGSTVESNVTHLFPNTFYAFCLVHQNKTILCKNCSTEESVPVKNPSMTTIQAGFTEINISWTPLTKEQQGGPHFNYKLFYWERDQPKNNTIRQDTVYSAGYLMSHLALGTEYSLEVVSENVHGPCHTAPQTHVVSTRRLAPPSDIRVRHEWREDELVATVAWTNDPTIDNTRDLTRRGSILRVWAGQEGNYTELESFKLAHNTHQLQLNLTEERGQDTVVSLSSYYGMHHSKQGPKHSLFYDVRAEAKANLIKLIILIVSLVLLGLVYIIFMCYCCRNLRREGKYRTGEGDKDNKNIDCTTLPVITIQDQNKQQAVAVDGWKDSGRSTVHNSSASLRMDNDELGFLYSGMDEDGSFIGDASFAINNGKEAIAMWREMDAGKAPLA